MKERHGQTCGKNTKKRQRQTHGNNTKKDKGVIRIQKETMPNTW
jgi:hypothetical protein